jgi:hypothetical protein
VVRPAPYRLFLKVLDYAVTKQLSSPDGTVGYINLSELRYSFYTHTHAHDNVRVIPDVPAYFRTKWAGNGPL